MDNCGRQRYILLLALTLRVTRSKVNSIQILEYSYLRERYGEKREREREILKYLIMFRRSIYKQHLLINECMQVSIYVNIY